MRGVFRLSVAQFNTGTKLSGVCASASRIHKKTTAYLNQFARLKDPEVLTDLRACVLLHCTRILSEL